MDPTIETSFLVISDTHADEKVAEKLVNLETEVDVAIHCGDLTESSTMAQFRSALRLLVGVKAHLNIVIAGKHDWAMDPSDFDRMRAECERLYLDDPNLFERDIGSREGAKSLFTSAEAQAAGIVFLDEGVHNLTLANGANLTVYASPYTCSREASWGFQYTPDQDHTWTIPATGIVVAITHSPPRDVLDLIDKERRNGNSNRAGSASLFSAIAKSKPKMHCFGHIHESWGAKMVQWRDDIDDDDQQLSHFTAVENDESYTIESLRSLKDMGEEYPSTCSIQPQLEAGRQTLFVNAALEELEKNRPQPGFIVKIPLSKAETAPTSKLDALSTKSDTASATPDTASATPDTASTKPVIASPASETVPPKKRRWESDASDEPRNKRTCWC